MLRKYPIRRIGSRTTLLMGADRELLMFIGLLTVVLIVIAQDWLAFGFGVFIWFFALWALRLMAKADPLMRPVYLRSLQYKNFYPARSTPFRFNTSLQERRYK